MSKAQVLRDINRSFDSWKVPGEVRDLVDLKAAVDGDLTYKENLEVVLEAYPGLLPYAREGASKRAAEAGAREAEQLGDRDEAAALAAVLSEEPSSPTAPKLPIMAAPVTLVASAAPAVQEGGRAVVQVAEKVTQGVVRVMTTPIVGYERVQAYPIEDGGQETRKLSVAITPTALLGAGAFLWLVGLRLAPAQVEVPATATKPAHIRTTVGIGIRPAWGSAGGNSVPGAVSAVGWVWKIAHPLG